MYVDDELNPEEISWTEEFVAQHPMVEQELALLIQTKLEPETVLFPNKEVLYRKERATVIMFGWRRIAAAIVILLAGAGVYLVVTNRNNINPATPPVSVNTNKSVTHPQTKKPVEITQPAIAINSTQVAPSSKNDVARVKNETAVVKNKREPIHNPVQETNVQKQNEPEIAYSNTGKQSETIKPEVNTIGNIQTSPTTINSVAIRGDNLHKDIFNGEPVTNPGPGTPDKYIPKGDEPVYASNNENKRLRGFFRKATRFIEHTNQHQSCQ